MNHQNEGLKSLICIEDNKNSLCQVHKCYISLWNMAKSTENKWQMLKMGFLRGYYLTSSKGISITNMRLRELHFKPSLLRGKIYKLSLRLDYWGRYWIWGIMITTWILLICTHYQDPWNSRSMLRNSRKKKWERAMWREWDAAGLSCWLVMCHSHTC